ncbi:MAG: XrtA/PEP-CTERM system TPR-repeat protein PrsT [Pseudomonadota bacterium]
MYPSPALRPTRRFVCCLATAALLAACQGGDDFQAHADRAAAYYKERAYPSAVLEYKNALQRRPDDAGTRLALAETYLAMGQARNAEKEALQAKRLGVEERESAVPLARAWLLLGEHQRVLQETRPESIADPTVKARLLGLHGDARLGLGEWKTGCELFNQAIAMDGKLVEPHWGKSRCALREGGAEAARTALRAALALDPGRSRSWSELGDLEYGLERLSEADAAYRESLSRDPADLNSLTGRAMIALRRDQPREATQAVAELDRHHPDHPLGKTLQALADFRQGRLPPAHEALSEVLKSLPNHLPSLGLHGMVSYSLGRFEDAQRSLSRYVLSRPESRDLRILLASSQIRLGRGLDALETLGPLLREEVSDAQAMVLAGEAELLGNKLARAREWFNRALARGVDPVPARVDLGRTLALQGDFARAKEQFDWVLARAPRQLQAQLGLARAQLAAREFEQAARLLADMERSWPNHSEVALLRAEMLLRRDQSNVARDSLLGAVAANPGDHLARLALAEMELRRGDPDAAEAQAAAVLKQVPNDEHAHLLLAAIEQARGRPKQALAWLEAAQKAHPQRLSPLLALTGFHLRQKNPLKALEWARRAEQLSPRDPMALEALGACQLAVGETANALASYHRLALVDPNSPEAHLKYARMQLKLNHDRSGARYSLRQAIRLKPDYLEAQTELVRLEIGDSRWQTAVELARSVRRQRPEEATGFILEGEVSLARRQFAEAAELFRQGQALREGGKALVKRHGALFLAGRQEEATAALDAWLAAQPRDVAVLLYRADVALAGGRNDAARSDLEAVQALRPDLPLVLNNLAALYQEAGDARALGHARKAHALLPGNAYVLDTLGWIVLEKGEAKEAVGLLRQAVLNAPGNPRFIYHLAAALEKQGARSEARERLRDMLKKSEKFPERGAAEALLARLEG